MDLAAIRASLEAARTASVTLPEGSFTLRLPTAHALRLSMERHRGEDGQILFGAASRAVLDQALTGWEGVSAAEVGPELADEPLAYSLEARGILLDHRQDVADALFRELSARISAREQAREAARKN